MNQYHITLSKGRILHEAYITGVNNFDLVPGKFFFGFTEKWVKARAAAWCKNHENKHNRGIKQWTYTP